MSLDWRGEFVKKKMLAAARVGINKTMGECVSYAKANHPFQNDTGTAERSIRIVKAARQIGKILAGLWGNTQVNYFVFLELGTTRRAAFPTLRPAAAAVYPNLTANIREAWQS